MIRRYARNHKAAEDRDQNKKPASLVEETGLRRGVKASCRNGII